MFTWNMCKKEETGQDKVTPTTVPSLGALNIREHDTYRPKEYDSHEILVTADDLVLENIHSTLFIEIRCIC